MAGQIKVNQVQLGDSATATNNFVWQTNVDGTAKLARGNVGATSQDILTVDASGKVTFSVTPVQPRYVSSAQTITSAGLLTLPHGLGAKPYLIMVTAICTDIAGDVGYAQNDEVCINIGSGNNGSSSNGISIYIDATNINIRFSSLATSCIVINNKSTGTSAAMANTKWQLYVRAEL